MAVITSRTGARSWATATDWVGNACPVDNVDSAVIDANCQMLMNQDQSAYTGLLGVTISGHATTPGMLYWANGVSLGHLKIKTGFNLLGTTGAAKGRLLANSNGAWGATGVLAFADKAIIDLGATSKIDAQYLDIALYCYQPTHTYLRTYGVRHTVTGSAAANTLTKNSHGLANATPVMIMGADIPAPLVADYVYYVVGTATNTFQLAAVSGGTAIDLTSNGSGTIEVYTGCPTSVGKVIPVFEDVTAETGWTTTAGHNRVVLVSAGPQNYDQQRDTLTTIAAAAATITTNNVDSLQYPGGRIYLISRNVSIRSACTTAVNICDYGSAPTSSGVFQCEIVATAGSGTTFYGYGVNTGTGHTISGTVSGCDYGVYVGTGYTISGTVSGCSYVVRIGDDGPIDIVVRGSATFPNPPTFYGRNVAGDSRRGITCEDYLGVLGASYAFYCTGDVIRNTVTVRSGGADNSLEVIPLSACGTKGVAGAGADGKIPIFEWVELGVPASAQTKSVYVKGEAWTTWPTAAQLYLEAEVITDDAPQTTTVYTSTQVLTDNTTWTALSVTFTPHIASRVRYRMWLGAYEGGTTRKVYVDNQLVTS